ncbi:MAG: hypothetical protein QM756_43175 [Polyangiaceae bacterium]
MTDPVALCDGKTLLVGRIYCSAGEACALLECGKPWSLYDANGCRRSECWDAVPCRKGERCVVAATAGNWTKACYSDFDGCGPVDGACSCDQYECTPLGVCLPESEFPAERDCDVSALDCSELAQASANLVAYREALLFDGVYSESPDFSAQVAACQKKIGALLAACP